MRISYGSARWACVDTTVPRAAPTPTTGSPARPTRSRTEAARRKARVHHFCRGHALLTTRRIPPNVRPRTNVGSVTGWVGVIPQPRLPPPVGTYAATARRFRRTVTGVRVASPVGDGSSCGSSKVGRHGGAPTATGLVAARWQFALLVCFKVRGRPGSSVRTEVRYSRLAGRRHRPVQAPEEAPLNRLTRRVTQERRADGRAGSHPHRVGLPVP